MNELGRMKYLDAMGIDSYVSRAQLPGAAPTRRLVIVPSAVAAASSPSPTVVLEREDTVELSAVMPGIPRIDEPPGKQAVAPAQVAPAARPAAKAETVRFSLAAIFVGGIAWVEELDDRPLAREQVQLVHAMAQAVSGDPAKPEVTQFDWPMHSNHQLDQGVEAAQASVVGFLQRQVEQRKCRGLVLLGKACTGRLPRTQLGGIATVETQSTLAMLRDPACKRQVWMDLQALVLRV